MTCDCDECSPCACGHKASEHVAGDGQCYSCSCARYFPDFNENEARINEYNSRYIPYDSKVVYQDKDNKKDDI